MMRLPIAGRAGEGDQIDARIGDQHLARHRRIAAGDDVEHAGREAGLGGQLAEDRAHASGVSGAGFRITVQPASSAATTLPILT